MVLNPLDPESYRVNTTDGVMPSLWVIDGGGGFLILQELDERKNENMANTKTIVRRLTETECERLQNFPDGWTDIGEWVDSKGKKHKPSGTSRYKALGNSIALPYWRWLANRICQKYDRQVTVGSLFDGISGFPLVFTQVGAKTLWTSEIEEFPIAVCKKHFGDEDTGEVGDLDKFLN